ncbi:MAG TPA: DUF2630 family protein [Baekduia sp.]|uniref:DUF2630 family protein n=1 Tax=Baekduia sp. TaxID=2600305 RepID=UPI002D77B533|nr:DUF2630 family protein [Baekduia sp.]HET6506252.1 DUF2630 family protein [Baekduia sp.]
MDDDQIRARIEELEGEERKLRDEEGAAAETNHPEVIERDADRLSAIKVELDQLWDLLRRREAARRAGNDPDEQQLRGGGTVEGYLG